MAKRIPRGPVEPWENIGNPRERQKARAEYYRQRASSRPQEPITPLPTSRTPTPQAQTPSGCLVTLTAEGLLTCRFLNNRL